MPTIRIPARSSRVPSKGGKSVKGGKRPIKGPKRLPPQERRDSLSSVVSSSSLSSPANLTNDEGYSGLDDVSDSDDDDADHVLAAEQEHIANERSSPRPTPDFDASQADDDDADDADDDDSDDDLSSPPRDVFSTHDVAPDFATNDTSSGSESWNGFNDNQDQPAVIQGAVDDDVESETPSQRRVHFQLPQSDSDSSDPGDNHDGFFPDIFVPENALDPHFRQELGQEHNNYSSDSQTYWDHHGDDLFEGFSEDQASGDDGGYYQGNMEMEDGLLSMLQSTSDGHGNVVDPPMDLSIMHPSTSDPSVHAHRSFGIRPWAPKPSMVPDTPIEAEGDDDSDDGYLSDGETTEEDEPVYNPDDSPVRRSLPRAASSDAEGGPDSPAAAKPAPPRKRVCILNPHTGKLVVLPQPKKRTGVAPALSPDQYKMPDLLTLQTISFLPPDQRFDALMNPGYYPVGGLWSGPGLDNPLYHQGFPYANLDGTMSTPPLFPNMGSEGSSTRTDDDEDEEDEGEKDLDVDLFLVFDSEDSDAEQDNAEQDNAEQDNAEDGEAAGDGKSAASDTPAFGTLAHLGGMNVGAFRRNQTTQQLIARGEATQDSLAFSNSLFHGTLRGIRPDALPAAATSLTPERRRKPQPTKSPLEISSLKRRASSAAGGAHKKQKSISEVGNMRL